jgi:hypothetical protein
MKLWGRTEHDDVPAGWKRVRTHRGDWTILLAPGFEQVHNSDSWQAYSGDRVVFLSSLALAGPDGRPAPVEVLLEQAAKTLQSSKQPLLTHEHGKVSGYAQIRQTETGLALTGYMCATGTLATCHIDYPTPQDQEWAVATWKSVELQ